VGETAPLLVLDRISRCYAPVEGGEAVEVLSEVDLELAPGESASIVGPSGSGKSTLLHIAGSLASPDSGRVLFDGRDLADLCEGERARFRNLEIGFVFQAHHLLPQCTALENVLVPTLVSTSKGRRAEMRERAEALLEEVGLAGRRDHRPAQLSGGECQRVAVVRALVCEPRLLLADEPTGSLDGRSAEALWDLIARMGAERELAVLAVTHALPLARRLGRVLELRDGRLSVCGIPGEG